MQVHDDRLLDGSIQAFLDNAERLIYTVGEATNYDQANKIVGDADGKRAGAMDSLTFSAIEDGTPDGRQVRKLAQVASANADYDSAANEVTHAAYVDDTNTTLLTTVALVAPITTSTSQPIATTADSVAMRNPDVP